MIEESRQYARCATTIAAEFEVEGSAEPQQGTAQDLSACGVGLHTRQAIAPLTTLSHLRMELEDKDGRYALDTTAVVVRSELLEARGDDQVHLSGVQFLDLEAAVVERVNRFVLDRLLGDE